jgi:hypothetical protein
MNGNRKKNTNTVHVGSLMKCFVAFVFFGISGLSYVYLINQMHARGNEISRLEKELGELNVKNEEARAKISTLSSRAVLQRRLNEGFIKMIAITDDRIVRLTAPVRGGGDEIRAVSNQGIEK